MKRDFPAKPKEEEWTAMDVLVAYAQLRGWETAKTGRPDIHRAGNGLLRNVAEGRVGWAFWPPEWQLRSSESGAAVGPTEGETGNGIWILNAVEDEDVGDETEKSEGDESGSEGTPHSEDEDDEEGEYSERDEENRDSPAGIGRFGALALSIVDDEEEEDKEADS